MEVSVSGFKCVGTWDEVVNHGEKLTDALEDHDVDEEDLAQWNEWRPSAHETFSEELPERTAEQASVAEGTGEKEDVAATEDAKKAGEKIAKSSKEAADASAEEAGKELKESAKHVARAVDSAGRKTLRTVEETVYQHVMTKMSPYYFDNELISANIKRKSSLKPSNDEEQFVFEVNINDDDIKRALKQEFSEEIEE